LSEERLFGVAFISLLIKVMEKGGKTKRAKLFYENDNYQKLVETFHVASEFKTTVYFDG
jgi:hypothetical protein